MQLPMSKGPERWKKRPRSPGLKWYRGYDTPQSLKHGRVLVIDYVSQGRRFQETDIPVLKEDEKYGTGH